MPAIWRAAVEQLGQGKNFVLATILSVEGSSPRHVGTRFIVCQDGVIIGTIGGGLFEADVRKLAMTVLEQGISHRVYFSFRGRDAESKEMICGGSAEVLLEYVDAGDRLREEIFTRLLSMTLARKPAWLFTYAGMPRGGQGDVKHLLIDDSASRLGGFPGDEQALSTMPESRLLKPAQVLNVPGCEHPVFLEWVRPTGTVYIFGAGHVGECVAHLAAYVNFVVVVLDDRPELASGERLPDADETVVVSSFDAVFENLTVDEDSYIVIVTRGHAHDRTVLAQALRTNAGYVGMIGSRRKTQLVYEALLKAGFSREDLQRVHAPIGLPIGGETPQEIAVSILAEMIQVRSRRDELKKVGA